MDSMKRDSSLCCSFQRTESKIECGLNPKAGHNNVIPLSLCQKSITGHLRSFHINTKEITSEAELVKLGGGLFKQNVSDLTICPNHRVKLGNNWKCGTLCNVGFCESARKKSLQNSSVSKQHSLFIWHTENRLVPIGSGTCTSCRNQLTQKMKTEVNQKETGFTDSKNETHGVVAQDEGSRRECASNKHPENLFPDRKRRRVIDTVTEESQESYTSVRAIEEWKKHVLRSVNQDRARSDVIGNLLVNEVLVERDWAMKFIPMLYREPQSKWFAKRGLNWHTSVGTFKQEDNIISHTVVHVFDSATQDGKTSAAILQHTLEKLSTLNPGLEKAYLRSDNAGCFHGNDSICSIPSLNKYSRLKINQVDFSDPQGGKPICDRRAAHIKSSIRKYVNEGHNVRNAAEFKEAVSGCNLKSISVVVSVPPPGVNKSDTNTFGSLPKITTLNNFRFHETFMEVFRQYEVGCGKKYSYKSLKLQVQQCQELKVVDSFDRLNMVSTNANQPRHSSSDEHVDDIPSQQIQMLGEDQGRETDLYTCSEPNCTASFSKYGNLLKHLDIGNHRIRLTDQITLSDKSKKQFASRMEEKQINLPSTGTDDICCHTFLNIGWGLKSNRKRKEKTEEQILFLKEKFSTGEKTGCKADPEEVAKEMRSAKTKKGARRFSRDNFLSATQIASYFSKLSLESRRKVVVSYEEEDLEADTQEQTLNELQELVFRAGEKQ